MPDRLNQYAPYEKFIEINTDVSMLDQREKELLKTSLNKDWSVPRYKMRWFQGQAQITKWAVFRQYVLELRGREESIEKLDYEIAKAQAEIEIHQYTIGLTPNPGEKKKCQVEIDYLTRQIARSTRMAHDAMLDRQYYLDLIQEMLANKDGDVPDGSGRKWIDLLYSDDQDEFERQLWTNRLGKQAALDLLFYGRIGIGNMDAILQMPEEQQTETLVLANNYAVELQNFQQQLQLEASQRRQEGQPADLKELQFPKTEDKKLENESVSKIELNGDDLDVYNN